MDWCQIHMNPMDWHSETSGFTKTGKSCQWRPCGCTCWINFTFPCTQQDLQNHVIKWDDRDGCCTASSNLAFKQRAGRDVRFFFLRNTSRICTSCIIRHFSSEIDKQALMKQKKWLEAKIRVHELLSNYCILYSSVLAVHCVCSQAIDRCHEACSLLALKHRSATRVFCLLTSWQVGITRVQALRCDPGHTKCLALLGGLLNVSISRWYWQQHFATWLC